VARKASAPSMPPISEQMKAWSAALVAEIGDWPQVSLKVFFGFTALYRGKRMFGLLPRTRCIETRNAIAFPIDAPKRSVRARLDTDPRIGSIDRDNTRWFTFELATDSDLHDALNWLGAAYAAAGARAKSKSKS
jgi:hypothetical protein